VDIFAWLREKWKEHQENKKWQEFYAKLDRNKEGRFSQKKYIRELNKQVKVEKERKKVRQEDAKK
jgi:hypothetical protein